MDIGSIIQGLAANSVTATVIYGLALLSFADFVTGITKAISVAGTGIGGTSFQLVYFDSWVKSKGTKLINIILVMIVGTAMPDLTVLGFSVDPVTGLGVGWAATMAFSLLDSIKTNASPGDKVAVPQEVVAPGAG